MSDSEEDTPDIQLKIVLLGDTACGKTSIVTRYVRDHFTNKHNPTIGVDFWHKRIVLPGDRHVAVKVHDVGGQSIGGAMLSNYVYGANGLLFVYDITNTQSFENLEEWYSSVVTVHKDRGLPHCVLLGNKVDLEYKRTVSIDKHKRFAEENDMSNHIVSAKTGDSIGLCFQRIVSHITGIRLPKSSQNPDIVRADVVQYNNVTPSATSRTSVCCLQ